MFDWMFQKGYTVDGNVILCSILRRIMSRTFIARAIWVSTWRWRKPVSCTAIMTPESLTAIWVRSSPAFFLELCHMTMNFVSWRPSFTEELQSSSLIATRIKPIWRWRRNIVMRCTHTARWPRNLMKRNGWGCLEIDIRATRSSWISA